MSEQQLQSSTESTHDPLEGYVGAVSTFIKADCLTRPTFYPLLEALTTAHGFYVEEHGGKPSGFLKKFQRDTGKSYSYLARLNRIRKDVDLNPHLGVLSFDACIALLSAPEETKSDIISRVETGGHISTASIIQQVTESKVI